LNFYKRYPADYQRKTARLTLAQHGAYTLLLDELYATETPLPADLNELYRICRAMSKPEQEAVRTVAEQFFPIGEDGLRHNRRAAKEIVEAGPAMKAARENGGKGGRPKKPKENPVGFRNENPDGNPLGFENGTQDEPNSKPPQNSELREEKENPPNPPVGGCPGFAEFWGYWPKNRRKGGRGVCEQHWRKQRLEAQAEAILAHVKAMARSEDWTKENGQYVPAPIVYLRAKKWDGAELDDLHLGPSGWMAGAI